MAGVFFSGEANEIVRAPQRAWCWTLNNYTGADMSVLANIDIDYLLFGKEVGENNTPHLQGYLYHKAKKSLKQLKALIPRAHFEIAKGNVEQNYIYCTKDGDFVERGVKPCDPKEKGEKGKAKIAAMWESAKKGRFEELPPAAIKQWEYIHAKYGDKPEDRGELDNLWLFGSTGVGKSKYVRENFDSFYSKPMSKWWDGYANESVVVLDDFAPEHGKYLGYYLKIWADHYVFNAEVKGGMLRIRPKKIIVTSQYSLESCFPEELETIAALKRRFVEKELRASLYSQIIN